MQINLQPEYGYVILAAILYSLECLLIGFLVAGRVRNNIFTEEYMKENSGG